MQSGESGVNILIDTPYRRVNSANLNSSLVYDGNNIPQGLINDLPEEFQFTTQLRLNEDFLNQAHNNKYGYSNLIDINCDEYNCIGIKIGIRKTDLITLIPEETEYNTLTSQTQSNSCIYITNAINVENQKFIIFRDYNNYVAEVKSYDEDTHKVTFTRNLPFIPESGTYIYIPLSIITPFIEGITDAWLLQEFEDLMKHTLWDDTDFWDDSKYWRETGDFLHLVSSIWWKIDIRINNNENTVRIEQGGV